MIYLILGGVSAFFGLLSGVGATTLLRPLLDAVSPLAPASVAALCTMATLCAALVAANLCGLAGREAKIELDGGTLLDRWDKRTGRVLMTGPAAFVFDGEYEA